jgi:hypothetical protein
MLLFFSLVTPADDMSPIRRAMESKEKAVFTPGFFTLKSEHIPLIYFDSKEDRHYGIVDHNGMEKWIAAKLNEVGTSTETLNDPVMQSMLRAYWDSADAAKRNYEAALQVGIGALLMLVLGLALRIPWLKLLPGVLIPYLVLTAINAIYIVKDGNLAGLTANWAIVIGSCLLLVLISRWHAEGRGTSSIQSSL